MEYNGVITVKNLIFKIKFQRSSHVLMTVLIKKGAVCLLWCRKKVEFKDKGQSRNIKHKTNPVCVDDDGIELYEVTFHADINVKHKLSS